MIIVSLYNAMLIFLVQMYQLIHWTLVVYLETTGSSLSNRRTRSYTTLLDICLLNTHTVVILISIVTPICSLFINYSLCSGIVTTTTKKAKTYTNFDARKKRCSIYEPLSNPDVLVCKKNELKFLLMILRIFFFGRKSIFFFFSFNFFNFQNF